MDEQVQQNKLEEKEKKAVQPKRGLWKPEEDLILRNYVETHGEGNWATVSKRSGLMRGGKSCRLRWKNYLRPNIKRGGMSKEEEDLIIRMHNLLGNRWSLIAGRLPGRTDNEVKNYWNTHLNKKSGAVLGKKRKIISMEEEVVDRSSKSNTNNHTTTTTTTSHAISMDKEEEESQRQLVELIDTKKPITQFMQYDTSTDDPPVLQVQPVLVSTPADGDHEKKKKKLDDDDEMIKDKVVKEEMMTSSGNSSSTSSVGDINGACAWMDQAELSYDYDYDYDHYYYYYCGIVESPVMMQVMNPNYSNVTLFDHNELQPQQQPDHDQPFASYLDSFLLFEAAAAFGTVDEVGIHSFNSLPALDP